MTLKFINPNINLSENVAVVGSSADIFYTSEEKIKKIDDFEDVIRFNLAETENFEKNVGSKTTLRFLSNIVFQQRFNEHYQSKYLSETGNLNIKILQNLTDRIVVLDTVERDYKNIQNKYYPSCKSIHFLMPEAYLIFKYKYGKFNFLNKYKFFSKQYSTQGNFLNLLDNKIFTTGLMAILLLVESGICPHVYGFQRVLQESRTNKRWYYRNLDNAKIKSKNHSWKLERDILKDLHFSKKIILVE